MRLHGSERPCSLSLHSGVHAHSIFIEYDYFHCLCRWLQVSLSLQALPVRGRTVGRVYFNRVAGDSLPNGSPAQFVLPASYSQVGGLVRISLTLIVCSAVAVL